MASQKILLVAFAFLLSGCAADDDLDWLRAPYEVSEQDKRNYAVLDHERFPIAALDLQRLDPKFRRQEVSYRTTEPPRTIIVDTPNRYLYLIGDNGRALRYGIEVGRQGFAWGGVARVGRKMEWPTWTPPPEMLARDARTIPYAHGMPGGPDNPLGARALYLFQGEKDTLYRIHGGGQPRALGKATSSGCIRLLDHDVVDLFSRVPMGTRVVVLQDPALSAVRSDKGTIQFVEGHARPGSTQAVN